MKSSLHHAANDDDEDGDDEDGDKEEGAPENYDEFSVPDGFSIAQDDLDIFLPLAKDLNATQAQAQDFIDMCSSVVQKSMDKIYAPYYEAETKRAEVFANDPEIGGDKKDAAVALALRAVKAYGSEAGKKEFDETGLGNNPELIRILMKVGKTVSVDSEVFGDGGDGGSELSDGQLFYPKN